MFQTHMAITYENFNFSAPDLEILRELRTQFYIALRELMSSHLPTPSYKGPFEVKGTRGQSTSVYWQIIRCICCTASVCRRIAHMRDPHSYINFLRSTLWRLNQVVTKGMKYGLDHEEEARQSYLKMKRMEDSTVNVEVPGLYMHTELPGQA